MAYVLLPKRRRVPIKTIRVIAQNNFVIDPPSDDSMMMAVLRRESRRRTTYGQCEFCRRMCP